MARQNNIGCYYSLYNSDERVWCNNFDDLFNIIIWEIRDMTMYQTDCFLHHVYNVYSYIIREINGYDENTFFSLIHFNNVKLANDAHAKRLMLNGEKIYEKYNKGVLYGVNSDGIEYYNHFRRNNDGIWYFQRYEEKTHVQHKIVKEYICEMLLKDSEKTLQELISMGAPNVIIENRRRFIVKLQNGELDIHGNLDTLEEDFASIKVARGKGGKGYYIINDNIYFFPNAKYGMYIKWK